ncbi:hypothetical protein AB0G04_37585 [Actinoplanes sp. NPDC023801]|uniref:hypothetical protein n=1 Tax=Actinoplanes sp. NPDC023801 TaxID=3154595 RepID=UPI0033D46C23
MFAVITVVPIWLCWWWMSRIPSVRWTVTLIMVGVYAGAAAVTRFDRNTFLVFLLTVAVLVATVVTGRALEHRRLGPGSARHQTLPLYVMAGWLLAMACALVVVINLPDPYE